MLKLKISQKILLFFLFASLVPLLVVIFLLVNSAQSQLRSAAIDRQKLVADKTATSVDEYLGTKVDALLFQSQIADVASGNQPEASKALANFLKQDDDLERVALLDPRGVELIVITTDGEVNNYNDVSETDAYKAATFLSGNEYVGPVTYGQNGQPRIIISIPIISLEARQLLNNLPSSEYAKYQLAENILGVLVAEYNISNLWDSVLATTTDKNGYAYVVDDQGNLVAHPDKEFLANNQNLAQVQAVRDVIDSKEVTRDSVSEKGVEVIATTKRLVKTNWAVVVEEPVTSIFSGITTFVNRSVVIFLGALALSLALSFVFRNQISGPISKLSQGAQNMGQGNFDQPISVDRQDELGDLAQVFNIMGHNMKQLVDSLKARNISLVIEQAKLSSILRSVSDGVMALNHKGEIISVNPPAAKLVHKKPEDLQGKLLIDMYPWVYDGKQFKPDLSRTGIFHFTDLILAHGDDISYLELVVSVIESKDSDIAAIITIHDLTPGRELDVMKLDFVAIAAHELRTPLTVVRGYLNLINVSAMRQLTIYNIENLQKAIIGTDQLNNLINNLLDIARIERGEMNIIINKLDLSRLVSDVVKQHQVTAIQKAQKIEYTGPEKKIFVPGDVSTLSEVLNNLIGNALKFTEAGGKVRVNLLANSDEVRVEIIDNGPGIPKSLQSRLFTKFYRVERSLVSGNRGTGLGLYISKTIIELHSGKIGLESEEGSGSTFYFTLPAFDETKHSKLVSDQKEKEAIGVHGWIKKRSRRRG